MSKIMVKMSGSGSRKAPREYDSGVTVGYVADDFGVSPNAILRANGSEISRSEVLTKGISIMVVGESKTSGGAKTKQEIIDEQYAMIQKLQEQVSASQGGAVGIPKPIVQRDGVEQGDNLFYTDAQNLYELADEFGIDIRECKGLFIRTEDGDEPVTAFEKPVAGTQYVFVKRPEEE